MGRETQGFAQHLPVEFEVNTFLARLFQHLFGDIHADDVAVAMSPEQLPEQAGPGTDIQELGVFGWHIFLQEIQTPLWGHIVGVCGQICIIGLRPLIIDFSDFFRISGIVEPIQDFFVCFHNLLLHPRVKRNCRRY